MSDLVCFLVAFLAFVAAAIHLESLGLLRRPSLPVRSRRRRIAATLDLARLVRPRRPRHVVLGRG